MAMKHVLAGFAVSISLAGSGVVGSAVADDTCPVLLTVYGEISNSNRGPIDDFDDVLLYRLGGDFEQAYTFCREDLAALSQTTITADYQNFTDGPVTATGPTLRAVLDAAGASATPGDIVLTAVDGYQFVVPSDTDLSLLIAAIEANGSVLGFGDRGPVWIFGEPGVINDSAGETDEGLVWALIMVEVE
ncbi:MAG: hypothetical protein AAF414_19335 [Pseudomonadota bacterium]